MKKNNIISTRQSLPEEKYLTMLGECIVVFNANNQFIIENLLMSGIEETWYKLTDMYSGIIANKIIDYFLDKEFGKVIAEDFESLVNRRNRILHSFQITENGEQILRTKTKIKDGNIQFTIDEKYLEQFVRDNEALCIMLDDYRNSMTK